VTARGGKQGETVTARLSPMMVALTAKFIRIGRMSRANAFATVSGNSRDPLGIAHNIGLVPKNANSGGKKPDCARGMVARRIGDGFPAHSDLPDPHRPPAPAGRVLTPRATCDCSRWRLPFALLRNRCGVRGGELVMKLASFENALTFATIALFVVFLVWGVKIIIA
jgi:hypothetical protein